jgi:hypothetical protein
VKRITIAVALVAALALSAVAIAKTAMLSGTYQTKITGTGANTLGGGLDGTWKLAFKHGKYTASVNGSAKASGKFTISGSTVSLGPGGAGCTTTGKYKFKLKGNALTFTKISDGAGCIGREGVLAHKFTKV